MEKNNFICRIISPGDKSLWDNCVRFEYDIFVESRYIKENPGKKIPSYDQYDHSLFLALFLENNRKVEPDIAGLMRLFYAPPSADKMGEGLFPSFDLYDRAKLYPEKLEMLLRLNPGEIINVGAMVVKKDFRTNECFMKLQEFYCKFCCENRYLYGLVAIENLHLHQVLKTIFNVIDIGPSNILFRGVPSVLVILDIFDQLAEAGMDLKSVSKKNSLWYNIFGRLRLERSKGA